MMNNISDKDAIRKKFENFYIGKFCQSLNKLEIKEMMFLRSDGQYSSIHVDGAWEGYQAATESCLSEFEQVAQCYVNNDGECEEIEYIGSMEQWDDDFTPLFTRRLKDE